MIGVPCPSCGLASGGGRYCGACGMSVLAADTRLLAPEQLSAAREQQPLHPGVVLLGRYRIDSVLAIGSMGAVYLTRDSLSSDAFRAVKELLQQGGVVEERAEAEAWFQREGETLARLRHPAIPQVHDAFSEGARHYLVMDLVEGCNLEQVVVRDGDPGLAEALVVSWADRILDVLHYLHTQQEPVIFRDLKPANVMLTMEGQIRLIDFGIARVFSRRTQGTAIGTPGYAPPEQYQGLAEPASDLYALAATMHHLLTGRDPRTARPFDFPPARSLAPHLSTMVAGVVDRALALDPRYRFDTAADMYRALHADTSLYDLPRLTAASESLALAEESAVVSVDAVDVQVVVGAVESFSLSADMVYLGNDENRVTFGGITLIASANRSQLELHNHTNKTLSCSFASSQFWLQPSLPSAWLGPHSMLQVSFDSITGVDTSGDSAVLRSSDASVTVREAPAVMLRVNGARLAGSPAPFRLLLPGPVPTAIVGLVSTISMILVFRAHMPASGFYGLNTLAVLVAGSAQWRRRRRS